MEQFSALYDRTDATPEEFLDAAREAFAPRTLLDHLVSVAYIMPRNQRRALSAQFRADFASVSAEQKALIADIPFDKLKAAYDWPGEFFGKPEGVPEEILNLPRDVRAQLVREKLLALRDFRDKTFWELIDRIEAELGLAGVQQALESLFASPVPPALRRPASPLMLPDGTSHATTRMMHALAGLAHLFELKNAGQLDESLKKRFGNFIMNMLNPQKNLRIADISDVYGEERHVPVALNDSTRIRVQEHVQEISSRFGVHVGLKVQGTSIVSPEECGFYALLAMNQARREHRSNDWITTAPRVFMLNNASRTKFGDGMDAAKDAQGSGLLYYEFDLGDGVQHHGIAYGIQTLVYLKPYISALYEVQGCDRGTQFRSLEYMKKMGVIVAMTDGELPLHHRVVKMDIEAIPDHKLAANEVQLMGWDKFGNGVCSKPASEIFEQFLPAGEDIAKVGVTLLSRTREVLVPETEYLLARTLGAVRDGSFAVWESSSPITSDPTRGLLNIGRFMKNPGDLNEDILGVASGSIVQLRAL